LLLAVSSPAGADDYVVVPGKPNLVRFESQAPLESFDGKTSQVKGTLVLSPAAIGDSIEVHLEVDLASFDTGIEIRNKHMRENHLETAKHPHAVFRGGTVRKLSAPRLEPGAKITFEIAGVLDLHGVQKPLAAAVEVTAASGAELHVITRFDVKLSDFGIPRPKFLVMKLDEVQKVTVDLVARRAAAPGS
jgi:polyisoprenoid-binding protein YceI